MTTTTTFKEAIEAAMLDMAEKDAEFSAKLFAENKSIDECLNYILHRVKESGANGFADEEVFQMAADYYNAANVKVEDLMAECTVIVNQHYTITDEEIASAKAKAIESLIEDEKRKLRRQTPTKPTKPEPKAEAAKPQQSSLF